MISPFYIDNVIVNLTAQDFLEPFVQRKCSRYKITLPLHNFLSIYICDVECRKGPLLPKIVFRFDFLHHWYLFVMNADHKFAALDWTYVSVQDTAGHRELKSIDGDFPTFEIYQNKPTNVEPSTSRALILQNASNIFRPISRRSGKT